MFPDRTGARRLPPALVCRGVGVLHRGTAVIGDLDLTVEAGEIVALLGPSRAGKSTLLHAVAGLVGLSTGEIWLAGRPVANPQVCLPPERRPVGMMFQDDALWPHLEVIDTVAYPIRREGVRPESARAEALQLLEWFGVGHLAGRRPTDLSVVERRWVGLARLLARSAEIHLYDEPSAQLDTHLRVRFQAQLAARQRATGTAALYATHDYAEAFTVADRVAVLSGGRISQVGTPGAVYAEPATLAVARLTGPASVIRARVTAGSGDGLDIEVGGVLAGVPGGAAGPLPRDEPARLLVRPDWAHLGGPFRGRLRSACYLGPHTDYLLEVPGGDVLVREPGPPLHPSGAMLSWGLRRTWVLPAEASAMPEPGSAKPVVTGLLGGDGRPAPATRVPPTGLTPA